MQFDLSASQDELYFSRYNADSVEIDGAVYHYSIHVNFTKVIPLEGFSFDQITEETFQFIQSEDDKPEIIIIGCGYEQKFIHPKIAVQLGELDIGIESMVTDAALRTFNLLKSDGRKVWSWICFP